MGASSTLNIRGSKLYEVTSTTDTATTTAVSGVVQIETLPQESTQVRDATTLTDTSAVRLSGRLKEFGTFAYVINLAPNNFASALGTTKILRLDIPADKDGTATTHEILRVWMSGGYTGDEAMPGSETEEVTRRRTLTLSGPAAYGTATASII